MSEQVDIRAFLSKKPEDVKSKPLLPSGMYKWVILSHSFGKSSKKQTDFIAFKLRPVEVGNNVDPSAMEMYKAEMKELGLNWEQEEREHQCYITANPNTQVMFKEFISKTGVNADGRTFDEVLPHTTGCQIWGEIKHETNPQRPGKFQERFGDFAKVEE